MSSADRWTQARVGLLVALAGVLLFGMVIYVGLAGTPFARRATLHVQLKDISGLAVGSRVEMGGVKIGEIRRVELPDLETGRIPLELAIEHRAIERIGASSRAFLGSHALVGQRFVGISPRRPDEPPIESGGTVQPKDTVDTEALLERAGQLMGQLDGLIGDVRSMAKSLSASAGDEAGPIGMLLHDRAMADELRRVVLNLAELSDQAAHGDGPLATIVRDRGLAKDLKDSARALATTARRIDDGQGVLGRLTKEGEAAKRVDRTLSNLETVTTKLADAQGTLGALISDPAMLTQLNALVGQLDSLVADLRRNPQRYIKIDAF